MVNRPLTFCLPPLPYDSARTVQCAQASLRRLFFRWQHVFIRRRTLADASARAAVIARRICMLRAWRAWAAYVEQRRACATVVRACVAGAALPLSASEGSMERATNSSEDAAVARMHDGGVHGTREIEEEGRGWTERGERARGESITAQRLGLCNEVEAFTQPACLARFSPHSRRPVARAQVHEACVLHNRRLASDALRHWHLAVSALGRLRVLAARGAARHRNVVAATVFASWYELTREKSAARNVALRYLRCVCEWGWESTRHRPMPPLHAGSPLAPARAASRVPSPRCACATPSPLGADASPTYALFARAPCASAYCCFDAPV